METKGISIPTPPVYGAPGGEEIDAEALALEFLTGIGGSFEEAENKKPRNEELPSSVKSAQNKTLIDAFADVLPNGMCAHYFAAMCSESIFEYSLQSLLLALEEPLLPAQLGAQDRILQSIKFCQLFSTAKVSQVVLSFLETFIGLSEKFASILVPLMPYSKSDDGASAGLLGCRALLSFLRQSCGFSSYFVGGSMTPTDASYRNTSANHCMLQQSPVYEVMMVLLCLTDCCFRDDSVVASEYDSPDNDQDDDRVKLSQMMGAKTAAFVDIAHDYMLRLSIGLSALLPVQINQVASVMSDSNSVSATQHVSENNDVLLLKLTQLQLVVALIDNLDFHFVNDNRNSPLVDLTFVSAEKKQGFGENWEIVSAMLNNIAWSLSSLHLQLYAYMPLLTMPVRSALLCCCLGNRFDLVITILKQPPQFDSKHELGNPDAQAESSTASHGNGGGSGRSKENSLVSIVQGNTASSNTSQSELAMQQAVAPEGDQSVVHFYRMNRIEAIQILSNKPMGTYIIRPHDTQPDLYFLSFKSTPEEGVKHAVIRKDLIQNISKPAGEMTIEYRCGKVGPFSTLEEILRAIDKALPNGLKFDLLITTRELQANGILLTETPSDPAGGLSKNDHSEANAGGKQARLDCNSHLWSCIFAQIAALSSSSARGNDGYENTTDLSIRNKREELKSHLRALERDDISCVDDMDWFQFPDSFRANSVMEAVLMMLTMKSLHRQLSSHRHIAVALLDQYVIQSPSSQLPSTVYATDPNDDPSALVMNRSMWHSVNGYIRCCDYLIAGYGHKLYVNFLPDRNILVPHQSSAAQLVLESHVNVVDSFLALLLSFIISSERVILSAIAPPSPLTVRVMPEHYQHGLFEGEELVQHMMSVLATRPVKFSGKGSGNGIDHVIMCMDSVDVMNWISAVITQFNESKHAGFSKAGKKVFTALLVSIGQGVYGVGRQSDSIQAVQRLQIMRQIRGLEGSVFKYEPVASLQVGASGTATANAQQGAPSAATSINTAPIIHEASVLFLMAVTCFVRGLFHGQDSQSTPLEGSETNNDSTFNTNLGESLDGISGSENALSFRFENAGGYIMWLMEAGLLKSGVKSGDIGFQQSHMYYYYSDPWEVKSMPESSLATELAKFGRYKYLPVTPYCGSSSLAGLMKYYSGSSMQSRMSTPKDDGRYTYAVDQAQDMRKLWESLRAESWLLTVIGSAFEYAERETGGRHINAPTVFLSYSGLGSSSSGGSTTGGSGSGAFSSSVNQYEACMSRYLYRNTLFRRLSLPHRFLAGLQVDIFGLKELNATQQSTFGFATASSSMDLFAVVRVVRASALSNIASAQATAVRAPQPKPVTAANAFSNITSLVTSVSAAAHSTGIGGGSGGASGGGSVGGAAGGAGGSGRVHWNNACTTSIRRVEATRTPSSNAVLGAGSTTHATQHFTAEYSWRDQALFKYSLAEGLISLRGTHQQQHQLDGSFYSPPNMLSITVYERTFFGESKLGDIELSMASLTDERAVRDWVPLRSEKAGTWLIHLQVLLNFSLVVLDVPHATV